MIGEQSANRAGRFGQSLPSRLRVRQVGVGSSHRVVGSSPWAPYGATRRLRMKRSNRGEDNAMASESKVQKVSRQAAMRQSIGTCKCGGELIWARVILNRPRMMKVCEECGALYLNDQAGLC